MRRACFLLVVLLASCATGFGQRAPKLTTPQIVATFQRLNQTTTIHPTTIYTPKNWGTFRISIVMVGTIGNGQSDGRWAGGLQFTDGAGENGPDYPFLTELFTSLPQTAVTEFPIRARAGRPMKFSVTAPYGETEGSKYNVWVVVEQLM